MPSAEVSLSHRQLAREWKHAARRHDALITKDDSHVVKRRVRVENSGKQFRRHFCIHGDARLDHVFKAGVAFENKQTAVTFGRHPASRTDYGIDDFIVLWGVEPALDAGAAQAVECPPDLRLKDDGGAYEECRKRVFDEKIDDRQVEQA